MYQVTECWNQILEMVFPAQPKWTELTFTRRAWLELQCYINLVGGYEVTGFGRVVDNQIVDVKILKQTVKPATVDCDVDAMLEFLQAIPKDQIGQWVLDWHSHVKMGVFASGTDSKNYEEQFEARLRNQFPYIIVNQLGDVYSRCYINPRKETEIKISILQEDITKDELLAIYEECKKDVEELCSKPNYSTQSTTWYDYDSDDAWGRYYGYNNNSFGTLTTNQKGKSCCNKKKDSKSKEITVGDDDDRTDKQLHLVDSDDLCISCGTYLADATEYDRGICDDCWEKMTPTEQMQYIENIKFDKVGYFL